ncbi:MAG: hypothetical protein ACI9UK_001845 [Candidatus Krumholzibacteriia bacterium]|jgi:uncharacterized protein YndB with AHSA1/START domain
MAGQISEARVIQYEFEVKIKASPAKVWHALTTELTTWWLADFHMLGEGSVVKLEAFPGGRLFEQNGDSGLLWYNVLAISKEKSISMAGYCTPEWGGPCTTLLTLNLQPEGDKTRLTVSDALYGRVDEKQADSLQSGWLQMFDQGLRLHIEQD